MATDFDRAALSVANVAYELDQPLEGWIRSVAEATRPALDDGMGVVATTFEIHGGDLRFTSEMVAVGEVPSVAELQIRAIASSLSPSDLGQTWGHPKALDTASGAYARMVPGQPFRDCPVFDGCRPHGVWDCMAAKSCDPTGSGMILMAPLGREVQVPLARARRWERTMAHLLAGLRLRQALGSEPEAVLDLTGRLHDARGPAEAASAREALRNAARHVDRARSKKGRDDARTALSNFRALIAGRWSLVDSFESDGRHFLVARQNDPAIREPRALSLRERQIVAYAALGHTNKYIAYTLGLAPSTVATHLATAMRRLGVRTRAQLAAVWSLTGAER
jgi:DNA-binding CsgD family transcriptional regulator